MSALTVNMYDFPRDWSRFRLNLEVVFSIDISITTPIFSRSISNHGHRHIMGTSNGTAIKTMDLLSLEAEWIKALVLERVSRPEEDILHFSRLSAAPAMDPLHFWGRYLLDCGADVVERVALGLSLLAPLAPNDLLECASLLSGPDAVDDFHLHGVTVSEKNKLPVPTLQTLLVLLAGTNAAARRKYLQLFSDGHRFFKLDVLRLGRDETAGSLLGRAIYPSPDLLNMVLAGSIQVPAFGPEFPAKLIETQAGWSDLILEAPTLAKVQEIAHWIQHERTIMDVLGMRKKIRPGYRALFYGPPGTGKTFTCALLGKSAGLPVYRVDLSMVVSKYIGETEKNLASVFNHAEKHKWILFFDEADALFGKRTAVSDARDRFANQEVSYLLQKVEEYDGVVILATNFKGNIDPAFSRRFENIVHFPMPTAKERALIWEATLPPKLPLEAGMDVQKLAEKYDLSGASIVDAVRAAVLLAVAAGRKEISKGDLMEGIQREYFKFGRVMDGM
jgi:hypothetical protein